MKNALKNKVSRRQFIKKSGFQIAGTTVALNLPFMITSHAAPDEQINIGLIGCGGRGTGAALDAVHAATNSIYPSYGYHTENAIEGAKAAKENVKIMAMADVFQDRLNTSREQLEKVGMNVDINRCFVGFDAYKKLLEIPEINYIILATPPHFRPVHLRAAIEAGKNVFVEKPVAVDTRGVKSVIESGELAKKKGLAIGAGTQRRRDYSFQEVVKRIHDGEIGDLRSGVCRWLIGELWYLDPKPEWTAMETQLRNWMYYNWLSGDIFVEQFIHSIDLMNWVCQANPIKAIGLGGRQVRTGNTFGNAYDHYSVQYEYPNDVTIFCLDRQINGCSNYIDDVFIGAKGRGHFSYQHTGISLLNGQPWRFRGEKNNAYQTEHDELIHSIRIGEPINEAKQIAESTMTAILGREACYSGKEITWEMAMNTKQDFSLEKYELGDLAIAPVPMPGIYNFGS
ncbi:MAG: Gfo/Idh/MocA family oxidoreductase [Cyclobacteriaceae bacterium]|nr:Gfo/Idh/MocA family oxidoreductase [Cyclobacteriaceae bacterium]